MGDTAGDKNDARPAAPPKPKGGSSYNPFRLYKEYKTKKRMEEERIYIRRDEQMKEDLERFLMEIEDKRTWIAQQLNTHNHVRMKKKEVIERIARKEKQKEEEDKLKAQLENGLMYFKGQVVGFKRWQNSGAKHLDIKGHEGSVSSCKLSKCGTYLLSCSEDRTMRLWLLKNGECLKVFSGHTKIVNDCDFHHSFKTNVRYHCLLSGSGDSTLRLWCSGTSANCTVLKGHTQAVYRCEFSPDGKSIVSCSEDRTIRTWSFPEGYQLFIYRAHASAVTTVRFSPTGRYLISGSDYGERKMLMWDAKMPRFDQPVQFPHAFYWTPEGLIRKILIRQSKPSPSFWLQNNQLSLVTDDDMLDIWPGEVDDPNREEFDSESDSEEEDDEDDDDDEEEEEKEELDGSGEEAEAAGDFGAGSSKKKKKKKKKKKVEKVNPLEEFTKDDIREHDGIILSCVAINAHGDQQDAIEYHPGGHLFVCLRSPRRPISHAVLDVTQKKTRLDMFSPQSGERVGYFDPEGLVPWRPEEELPRASAAGNRPSSSSRRSLPVDSLSGKSFSAKEAPSAATATYNTSGEPLREVPPGFINSLNSQVLIYDETVRYEDEPKETILSTDLEVMWCSPDPDIGDVVVQVNYQLRGSDSWQQLSWSLKESAIRVGTAKSQQDDNATAATADGLSIKYDFDQEDRHRRFWDLVRDKKWYDVASFLEKKSVAYNRDEFLRRNFRVMNLLASMFDGAKGNALILHPPFVYTPGVTRSVVLCETDYYETEDDESDYTPDSQALEDEEEARAGAGTGDRVGPNPEEEHENDPSGSAAGSSDSGSRGRSDADNDHAKGRHSKTRAAAAALVGPEDEDPAAGERSNVLGDFPAGRPSSPAMPPTRVVLTENISEITSPALLNSAALAPVSANKDHHPRPHQDAPGHHEKEWHHHHHHHRHHPHHGGDDGEDVRSDLDFSDWGDSSDGSGDNNRDALLNRPKAHDQKLPKLIFSRKIEARDFLNKAVEHVRDEASRLLRMEADDVATRREIRHYQPSPAFAYFLLQLPPTQLPHWVSTKDFKELREFKYVRARKLQEKEEEEKRKTAKEESRTTTQLPQSALIKSGKFGPDIEDFTMPLPVNFPLRAGLAIDTVAYSLAEYEKKMVKVHKEELPSTLQEVYVPSIGERINKQYHKTVGTEKKLYRADLERSLVADAQMHLLEQYTYVSRRRETFLPLPGMTRHYPNPYYPVPAFIPPGVDFPREKDEKRRSTLGKIFSSSSGASHKKKQPMWAPSRVVLPVGRRPLKTQLRLYELASRPTTRASTARPITDTGARAVKPSAAEDAAAALGITTVSASESARAQVFSPPHFNGDEFLDDFMSTDGDSLTMTQHSLEEDDGSLASISSLNSPSRGTEATGAGAGARVQHKKHPQLQKHGVKLASIDTAIEPAGGHSYTPPMSPAAPALQKHHHWGKHKSSAENRSRAVSGIATAGHDTNASSNLFQSFPPPQRRRNSPSADHQGSMGNDKAKRQRRKRKKKRDGKHRGRLIGNYPKTVFLGRRGIYPVAPGLEEFSASLREELLEQEQEQELLLQQERSSKSLKGTTATAAMTALSCKSGKASGVQSTPRGASTKVTAAAAASADDEEDNTRVLGIVRRFRINGFELAHHGAVNDAVFSPSEGRVATAGGDALIKIWDPRDGTLVRILKGHDDEVLCVKYEGSEQFLISAGADASVLIWSMLTNTVNRRLRGHVDVIYGLAASKDCSVIVSCSHDTTMKTWRTTPQRPDPPDVPRILTTTDTTALVSWVAPPSFNLDINGYHLQYRLMDMPDEWLPLPESRRRVRLDDDAEAAKALAAEQEQSSSDSDSDSNKGEDEDGVWGGAGAGASQPKQAVAFAASGGMSMRSTNSAGGLRGSSGSRKKRRGATEQEEGFISIPPHFRTKMVRGLMAATEYQFRVRASNRLGLSNWSRPSKMVKTQYGLPEQFETPIVCSITETSVFLYWYAPNPITYGSASKHFEVQCTGDGKSYEQMPTLRVSIEEAMAQGQVMMDTCRLLYTDYVKTKDNLIRSKRFHIHRSKALTVAKAHEAKNEPTSSPAPPAATTPRAKHDEAEDTSVAPNTPAASVTTAGDDGGDGANGTGHGAGANVDNSLAASGSVSAMELTPSQAMGDRDTVSSVSFTADPLTDAASMGSAGFLNSPAAVAASAATTQIPQLSDNMSIDRVKEILEDKDNITKVFVVAEYPKLKPGYMYIFRTRGVNVAGNGPWSVPTYSTFTNPVVPSKPKPPTIVQATLRSILFGWEPPDDGGSAITGYTVVLQNSGRHIELPRTAVSYLWEGLFPGRKYFLKVRACNEVGYSEFSHWNSEDECHTMTDAPETPSNPRAVSADWKSMTLQTRMPYSNGSEIVRMAIEKRFITPFQIGDWLPISNAPERNIADAKSRAKADVKVVEQVDAELQQLEMEAAVAKLETLKASAGFNPYAKDAQKIDGEIEEILNKQKPEGSLLEIVVEDLEQDTLYEFRVCFTNATGTSKFSQPSHRAKTNKAALPGACTPPEVTGIFYDSVLLDINIPPAGGAPVHKITVDIIDMDDNSSRLIEQPRSAMDEGNSVQCRISALTPKHNYIFRCRVSSLVGDGEFSPWCPEVKLPAAPEVDPNNPQPHLTRSRSGAQGVSAAASASASASASVSRTASTAAGAGGKGRGGGISIPASRRNSIGTPIDVAGAGAGGADGSSRPAGMLLSRTTSAIPIGTIGPIDEDEDAPNPASPAADRLTHSSNSSSRYKKA